MNDTAIVIVNYNGRRWLKNLCTSLQKQSYKKFELYFIDNASSDDSCELIKKLYPNAIIHKMRTNTGFVGGNNFALRKILSKSNMKYAICLNNDTIVHKNWLNELVTLAKKNKDAGMISSVAYFPDGRVQNAGLSLEKGFLSEMEGGISIGYGKKDPKFLRRDYEVFAASGVAVLYKTEALKIAGLFDDSYFAYVEDLDLGFRIRHAGYRGYVASKAKLIHFQSGTMGKASLFKIKQIERNNLITALKNLPLKNIPTFIYNNILTKFKIIRGKTSSAASAKQHIGKGQLLISIITANLSIVKILPQIIVHRREILGNSKLLHNDILILQEDLSRRKIEKSK